MKIIKPKNYWTKDNCIKDAKKYKSRLEWQKNSKGAYNAACKNGWLDECCKYMKEIKKPNGYWTKDNCIKDAKKYKGRYEWKKKSNSAYSAASINKYLDECCKHMKEIKKPNGYWTKERCIEDAKKYKGKKEWEKNSNGAYQAAVKNKWLDECCKHMFPLGNRRKRMVYCYVFPDKSCYVGLTFNEEQRKKSHLNNTKKNSPVFNRIKKTNLIPQYIKISDYVLDIEAQKIEFETINEYRKNGYMMLNTAKAGGLGGIKKWVKKDCIEDAKKYKSRLEWKKKSSGAYQAALRNKWLDECCKHMKEIIKPKNYWTKDNCIKDAKKYKGRKEWKKKSSGAYQAAVKNKWLDECCKHMKEIIKPNGYWTKDNCIEDAKKYNTKSEWEKNSRGAYYAACKNGWLDECCKHMKEIIKPKNYWTKDNCIKDAKKYNTRSEWQKNSKGAYCAALRNKWLDECFPPKELIESLEMV